MDYGAEAFYPDIGKVLRPYIHGPRFIGNYSLLPYPGLLVRQGLHAMTSTIISPARLLTDLLVYLHIRFDPITGSEIFKVKWCIIGTSVQQKVNLFKVDLFCFDTLGTDWNIPELDILLIVSSTTGDGEQPEVRYIDYAPETSSAQ